MATDHLHSVKLESGGYHHLFNLTNMVDSELAVLQMALEGKPVPADMIEVHNNLKILVNRMATMAIMKNEKARAAIDKISEEMEEGDGPKEVEAEMVTEDTPS